jgi:KDO2-lipid IV(A) lauroyltransferase
MRRSIVKTARHLIEAAVMWSLYFLIRLFPLDTASNIGAWLGGKVGKHLKANQTALTNLRIVFPEHSDAAREDIARQMWDNLGRVIFEFPFVNRPVISKRIEIIGAEHVQAAKETGRPIVYVSGHFGNWELSAKTSFLVGSPLVLVYRKSNNPWTDTLVHRARGNFYAGLYPKGASAAIRVVKALKKGKAVGMLLDQKMNNGIAVPFFGQPAMTAPALAEFAFRYNAIIIPSRVIRKDGAYFKTIIEPPLEFKRTGNETFDTLEAMKLVNQTIERWIGEHPPQWFWVHKRFDKALYQ